ncbi:MAG: tetratricopeptide repeat protein [bacterium]|nr:tetratricopeptide repeat protein [bacterium]
MKNWLWLLLPLAGAVTVYHGVHDYDFVRVDDVQLITRDWPDISRPGRLVDVFGERFMTATEQGAGYYRPLPIASLVIDAQWTGREPGGYHLGNLLLHCAVLVVFYFLLLRLGFRSWLAGAGTLVLAIHPAAVHAVGWIPGRVDLLLTLCSLLAAWFFLEFVRRGGSPGWLGLHLAGLLAALFCKESAVLLAPLLWMLLWLRGGGFQGLMPRAVAGQVVVIGIWVALHLLVPMPEGYTRTAAEFGDVLAMSPLVLANLGKMILPWRMTTLGHHLDVVHWPGLVAALLLGFAWWRNPGRERRWVVGAVLWMLVFSVPTLFAARAHVLENRLYGIIPAFVVLLLVVVREILADGTRRRLVVGAVAALWCAFLVWTTVQYLPAFRDYESFLENSVARSPSNTKVSLKYVDWLLARGDDGRARGVLESVTERAEVAEGAHNALGLMNLRHGRYAAAEGNFRDELAIDTGNVPVLYNLGSALYRQERLTEARSVWESALRSEPGNASVRGALAEVERRLGR